MRLLDTNIKADFVNKHKSVSGSTSSAEELCFHLSRPNSGNRSQTADGSIGSGENGVGVDSITETPKKPRPRSFTFTLSKGDQSPSKKRRSERPGSHQRAKSGGATASASSSSTSMTPDTIAHCPSFFSKASKQSIPEEYISYLKKVQQPEVVDVGKVHKLRQLLRNETVHWVDRFITQGGMIELVELLYRIKNVEWRYVKDLGRGIPMLKLILELSMRILCFMKHSCA